MSDYINEIYSDANVIYNTAFELKSLATAFYKTGNEYMFDVLDVMADGLVTAQDNIRKSLSKELSDQLNSSQQRAGETLLLCLESLTKELK